MNDNSTFVAVTERTGTIICDHDFPEARRGMTLHASNVCGMDDFEGVITRRLRLRDGRLKLWWRAH